MNLSTQTHRNGQFPCTHNNKPVFICQHFFEKNQNRFQRLPRDSNPDTDFSATRDFQDRFLAQLGLERQIGGVGLEPTAFLCAGFTDRCPHQLGHPPDKSDLIVIVSIHCHHFLSILSRREQESNLSSL